MRILAILMIVTSVSFVFAEVRKEDTSEAKNNPTENKVPAPPATASKTPEKIICYFCDLWEKGNYKNMYGALSQDRQEQITLSDWENAMTDETKKYGLLKSYEITGPDNDIGSKSLWTIKVTYSNTNVPELTKQSWVIQTKDGWRIDMGGLGPLNK